MPKSIEEKIRDASVEAMPDTIRECLEPNLKGLQAALGISDLPEFITNIGTGQSIAAEPYENFQRELAAHLAPIDPNSKVGALYNAAEDPEGRAYLKQVSNKLLEWANPDAIYNKYPEFGRIPAADRVQKALGGLQQTADKITGLLAERDKELFFRRPPVAKPAGRG